MAQSSPKFLELWSNVEPILKKIMPLGDKKSGRVLFEEWENAIRQVHAMCRYVEGRGPGWRGMLHVKLRSHLSLHLQKAFDGILQLKGDELIIAYCQLWNDFKSNCKKLDALFTHYNNQIEIDRKARTNGSNFPLLTFSELALYIWNEKTCTILMYEITDRVINGFEPRKFTQDELSKAAETMLDSFSLINGQKDSDPLYEGLILEQYASRCNSKAAELFQKHGAVRYVQEVAQLQCKQSVFLSKSLLERMDEVFLEQCGSMYKDKLLEAAAQIAEQELADQYLQNLLKLLKLDGDAVKELAAIWKRKIESEGLDSLCKNGHDQTSPVWFVRTFMDFFQKHNEFVKVRMGGDEIFAATLTKACIEVFDSLDENAAVMFARYCNFYLTKAPGASESEAIENVDKAFDVMFTTLRPSDFFEEACVDKYAYYLVQRLLNGTSLSAQLEYYVANKFFETCNNTRAAVKLINLFDDVAESTVLTGHLSNHLENADENVDKRTYTINILSSSAWPICERKRQIEEKLPATVGQWLQGGIEQLYKAMRESHSHRELKWSHDLTRCKVQTSFLDQQYLLEMNLCQAEIMMQFNGVDKMSIAEIQKATEIPEKKLRTYIASLVHAKLLTANKQVIDSESEVMLNKAFSSQDIVVKVIDPFLHGEEIDLDKGELLRNPHFGLILKRMEQFFRAEKMGQTTIQSVIEKINASFQQLNLTTEEIGRCVDHLLEKNIVKLAS